MGQRYRKIEDQKPGPELAWNLDFAKGEGLEPKVKNIFKIVQIGRRGEQTSLTQTHCRRGLEATAGRFFVIFCEKKNYFNAIWITSRTFLEPFEITKVLRFEIQLKKSNERVFPLLTDQVQNTFKILNLGIKFC